ncbi:AraC family transcriptional regulator [Paenibacillus allorhizosphaerae]
MSFIRLKWHCRYFRIIPFVRSSAPISPQPASHDNQYRNESIAALPLNVYTPSSPSVSCGTIHSSLIKIMASDSFRKIELSDEMVRIMDKYGPIYHFPSIGDIPPPINVPFIGINYCTPHYRNVRRMSKITVIGCVLSGRGKVRVNAQTSRVQQGDVFIMRSGCFHEVISEATQEEPWIFIWYNVHSQWALNVLEAYRLLSTVVVSNVSLESLFRQGIEWAESKTIEEMQGELQHLFMQIVIRLSEIQRSRGELLSLVVRQIKLHLDNQLLKPFHTEQLVNEMGLSAKHLNRVFKKEMGTTIYNYVLTKKMESAKLMLIDTTLTVNEISEQLGYSDAHYFSNLFKQKNGMRPSVFRSQFSDQEHH